MRPNPQETANFVTFTEVILNEKLHFLSSTTEKTLHKTTCLFLLLP